MPDPIFEADGARALLEALGIHPEDIEHGDRPDVRFRWQGVTVGLEVCEATPEEYHRGRKAVRDSGWEQCTATGNWLHRQERRSTEDLKNEGTASPVWVDVADVHLSWQQGFQALIHAKHRAFAHPEFRKFDQNWLLVTDCRTSPISHEPDIEVMTDFFQSAVRSFRPDLFFDLTFVNFRDGGLICWDHRKHAATWTIDENRKLLIS